MVPITAAGLVLPGAPRRPLEPIPVAPGLDIIPRHEWGPGLDPTGPLPDEPDVRFLLVHHSVHANTYGEGAVPEMLAGIHRFHTGERGWPDIAYNVFVDRFGRAWEGRIGSIDGLKAGDATGGNQGYAQLCCFLGDHSQEPPSAEAQATMGRLLGWLAARSGIDVTHGATTTFVSRGSNLHPAGSEVTTTTIAGHRDMSRTACPGDGAQALVLDGTFSRLAAAAARAPEPTATTATTERRSTTTGAAQPPTTHQGSDAPPTGGGIDGRILGVGSGAAILAATAAVATVRRRQAVASHADHLRRG